MPNKLCEVSPCIVGHYYLYYSYDFRLDNLSTLKFYFKIYVSSVLFKQFCVGNHSLETVLRTKQKILLLLPSF